MADNSPILIGRDNLANPGAQTLLSRADTSISTDPVFTVRTPVGGDGIHGEASGTSTGVHGISEEGTGVLGESNSGTGVVGTGPSSGVQGSSDSGIGIHRESGEDGLGVFGVVSSGFGVAGLSTSGVSGVGVYGVCPSGTAVRGDSDTGVGVYGLSTSFSGGIGVFGEGQTAGRFNGPVTVSGDLTVVNGDKPFKIDHPLDPPNKYLLHNAVEAPERKNVYDGLARLDEEGAAWVELPEWFEALNGDFRYQLTAVGGSAPGLHVAEEISENRFKIAGGQEGMKVCWQLTGTRKDPWAAANPFEVEQEKPQEERGRYLEPSLYDAPEEQRVMMGPPRAEAVEEEQRPPEPSGIDFAARLEEEHRHQLDELGRLEEEQRRELEELRRRMEERQEEVPPEST